MIRCTVFSLYDTRWLDSILKADLGTADIFKTDTHKNILSIMNVENWRENMNNMNSFFVLIFLVIVPLTL